MPHDKIQRLKSSLAKFAKDRDWEQFHTPKNLAMAMSVEAAEVVEIFQWLTERQSRELAKPKIAELADELADTYIYLLRLAAHYDIDLVDAATKKIRKSALKYPVHKARGSAKKYTDL
jgi:NTP pyrophosphatase (non-canonical NTP hydrolase)